MSHHAGRRQASAEKVFQEALLHLPAVVPTRCALGPQTAGLRTHRMPSGPTGPNPSTLACAQSELFHGATNSGASGTTPTSTAPAAFAPAIGKTSLGSRARSVRRPRRGFHWAYGHTNRALRAR